MLEKIKLLLNKMDDPTVDKTLNTLISICKQQAYVYCNLEEYDNRLDFIVIEMVIERFNRIGSENLTSQRSSGVGASYESFYSDKVRRMLNKFRKVKTVQLW